MKYKQVKYFRRTPVELVQFRKAVAYYTELGYPKHVAEQYAYDMFHAGRRGKAEL